MLAQINWHPSNPDLRKFGLTLIIGFALIGGLVYWLGNSAVAFWMWKISVAIGLLALLLPPLSLPFYWAWMGIAFVMGTIISFFIVALIYYVIITPVGLIMKIIGRDALKLKKSSFQNDTYWETHPDISSKDYYKRLF